MRRAAVIDEPDAGRQWAMWICANVREAPTGGPASERVVNLQINELRD
jgi:hypothetical protein